MEQLVIGRELPNLKITLAGLETTNSNSNMETDVMEVDEEQEDKTHEEDDIVPNVKIDVKLEFMSYKGMKRYENKAGALTTGLDITSEEFQERLKKRAARFQMECRKMNKITEEEIDALYKSLNINDAVSEKSPEKARGIRLDAIHIRGVNDMSTDDIFAYFGEYGPSSIEWINDVSCNVVWLDASSAARALLGLSRPLILHRRKKTITEENDTEVQSQETEEEETFIEGGEEVIMMSEDESSDEESMAVDNSQQQDSDISSSVINNNEETVVTSAATGIPTTTVDTCAANSPVTTTTPEGPVTIAVQGPITTTTPPLEGPITTTTSESPIIASLPEDTVTTTPPESPVTTTLSKDSISNVTTSEDPTTTTTLEEPVTTTTPENPVTSTPPEEIITSVPAEDPISTTTPDENDNELEEKVDEELPLSVPPGYWRLGIPHPKAKVLLLRFASKDDRKIRGAEKRSVYYKKYGNPNYGGMKGLISNSRKRRFWQIQQKRELQELGIKRNEMTDVGLQSNDRGVETSSSESENELNDTLKPFRQKLRMKMYADEEENKQKQKRLRLLRYNRKGGRTSSRKRLIQSVMIGNAQHEDSDDDSFDEQDDMVADYLRRSGTSVWKRLTNLDENNSSEFEETSDLRNKLQSRGSSVEERTRSTAPVTGDLRSKLDRIRNKHVHKHRSPLLIRVANEETD